MATDPLPTIVLLNSLSEAGFLSGGLLNVQGGRWRQGLVSAVRDLLASLASSSLDEAERRTLGQLLRLLPVLASDGQQYLSTLLDLVRRFTQNADSDTAEATWKEGAWNDSHLLSAVLKSCIVLARARDDFQTQMQAELLERNGLATLIRGWRWNREVLDDVAEFSEMWSADLRYVSRLA
jgi:U3 small nucleolar RNA-associated protein 20